MKNRAIGFALAIALCGLSPASAETLQQAPAKASKASRMAEKPSAVRQLIDLMLRKQVAPAEPSSMRKSPIGKVFYDIETDVLDCTDPTLPCRAHAPIPG